MRSVVLTVCACIATQSPHVHMLPEQSISDTIIVERRSRTHLIHHCLSEIPILNPSFSLKPSFRPIAGGPSPSLCEATRADAGCTITGGGKAACRKFCDLSGSWSRISDAVASSSGRLGRKTRGPEVAAKETRTRPVTPPNCTCVVTVT